MSPTPATQESATTLKQALVAKAQALGFASVGVVALDTPARGAAAQKQAALLRQAQARFYAFLAQKRYGDMDWLATRAHARAHASALWPKARSIVMLGYNYAPADNPLSHLEKKTRGNIAVYALGRDYHKRLTKKLKCLAAWLMVQAPHGALKHFVDTAPILEKPLAMAAGLGWQGKHTNLVARRAGSWLFLASLWTTLRLPSDAPQTDSCGSCRACLDICPTNAFPAPYQLDARRCISYLTIEHKGHIAREFRSAIGNRIYGCDDCLAVCPWNKYAQAASAQEMELRRDLQAPDLGALAQLSDTAFRQKFSATSIKRTGRDRFVRNVLIAIGNARDATLVPVIEARLGDASALVRAAAVWALGQYLPAADMARRGRAARACETDAAVCAEWEAFS